jgi:hypothetical protein
MNASDILERNKETFTEKGKEYGHSYKDFGKTIMSLFPNGIMLNDEDDVNKFSVFFMMVHKISRIANTGLKSTDSMKDLSVYSAILEELCSEEKK